MGFFFQPAFFGMIRSWYLDSIDFIKTERVDVDEYIAGLIN